MRAITLCIKGMGVAVAVLVVVAVLVRVARPWVRMAVAVKRSATMV